MDEFEGVTPYPQPEHQPYTFGEGPKTALLLHGFPGTAAETRPLGEALAKAGWQAHGVLLPGFGPDIVNLAERTRQDWIEAALDAYHTHEADVLIGYSMGAALALSLLDHVQPEQMVLIAPFWSLPGILPRLVPIAKLFIPEMKPFQNADFSDPDTRERFVRIMPGIDLDDPEVQERLRTGMTLPLDSIHEVLKLGRQGKGNVPGVRVPTLVIQGTEDEVVKPQLTYSLVRMFRADVVTLHKIEGGGHDLIQKYATYKEHVAQKVIGFLAAHTKTQTEAHNRETA